PPAGGGWGGVARPRLPHPGPSPRELAGAEPPAHGDSRALAPSVSRARSRLAWLEQLEKSPRGGRPAEARHVARGARGDHAEPLPVLIGPLELLHDLLEAGVVPDLGRLIALAHGGLSR